MKTVDIFIGRPRETVMMTVSDSGDGMAMFECEICGSESDWLCFDSYDDISQGIPCDKCNEAQL